MKMKLSTILRPRLHICLLALFAMIFYSVPLAYADGNKGGGLMGTTVDFIGEVLAFPFQLIAEVFRFVF